MYIQRPDLQIEIGQSGIGSIGRTTGYNFGCLVYKNQKREMKIQVKNRLLHAEAMLLL